MRKMRSRSAIRRRRVWRVILLILVAVLTSLITLAAFVIWLTFPPKATLERVDVVVVMAGATDGRHDIGERLVRTGVADNLVVSNPLGRKDPAGHDLCTKWETTEYVEAWCMDPLPPTTTGEAQTFEVLAAREGWNTAVVVTNRPHHRRVKLNFDQCTGVEATVTNIDNISWHVVPYQVGRELGGFFKFWFTLPC